MDYGVQKMYVDVHIHLYDPLYESTIEAVLRDAETAESQLSSYVLKITEPVLLRYRLPASIHPERMQQ